MNLFQKIVIFFLTVFTEGGLLTVDHAGTEFLLSFSHNSGSSIGLSILLSADDNATVTVQNNILPNSTKYFVLGGTSVQVALPGALRYDSDLLIEYKSLYISSSSPINVYVSDNSALSTVGYHAIPIRILSSEYIAVSYPVEHYFHPWVRVAAVENATHINIQFRVAGNGTCSSLQLLDGDESNFTLNQFEVIGYFCSTDLTGTIITSDKPITVFSGHTCIKLTGPDGIRCDSVEEMLPPLEVFGKSYVLYSGGSRRNLFFRIVAKDNDTELSVSDGRNYTIERGNFTDIVINRNEHPLCLTSSKPVMVVVNVRDRSVGDCLSFVPSVEHFGAKKFVHYHFEMISQQVDYFLSVLIHQNNVSSLNASITPDFVNISSCDYAAATFQQTSNSFTIHGGHDVSVGVMMYAAKNYYFAFGYPVGMAFDHVPEPSEITSSLIMETISTSVSDSIIYLPTSLDAGSNSIEITPTTVTDSTQSIEITPTIVADSTQQLEPTPNYSYYDSIFSTSFSSELGPFSSESTLVQKQTALTMSSVVASPTSELATISVSPITTTPASSETTMTSVCRCSCRGQAIETKESASQYSEEIKKNLTVDVATLSKTILKKISVNDQRPTAQAAGAVGMLMLIIPTIFIVLPDIFSIFRHMYGIYHLNKTENP